MCSAVSRRPTSSTRNSPSKPPWRPSIRTRATSKRSSWGRHPLAIRLDIKNTDVTLNGSSNPELYIDMPKCTIQELGRPFKVKDLVYQTIKFKASYSISDTLMAKIILTNAVSTY